MKVRMQGPARHREHQFIVYEPIPDDPDDKYQKLHYTAKNGRLCRRHPDGTIIGTDAEIEEAQIPSELYELGYAIA